MNVFYSIWQLEDIICYTIVIVTQRFGEIAILLCSLKQVFWKQSAFYIRYLHNNIKMLLMTKVHKNFLLLKFVDRVFLLVNPLNAKFTKWSNILKQFVGKLPTNCLSVFDHFVGLALKGFSLWMFCMSFINDIFKNSKTQKLSTVIFFIKNYII